VQQPHRTTPTKYDRYKPLNCIDDPGYSVPGLSKPGAITAGPDGALWFLNYGSNTIGRITTTGQVTSYTDPSINSPDGITAGPDGAVWFTNGGNNSIGRITTSGQVTSYADPGIENPEAITTGPGGALWFTPPTTQSGA
jgi:virginiamycin B lyase